MMVAASNSAVTALYISSAVVTSDRRTPCGVGAGQGPATRVTEAPHRQAAAARAKTILPISALYISSAVVTSDRRTPCGVGAGQGPATRVTEAPHRQAAAARAKPILP